MENPRGLIVLLAYNEEECIASTVAELKQLLPAMDVLVVDDGSADQTAVQARSAGAYVLTHPFNLGVAAAEASGLLYAARHGYRRVIRMDGDGQHDPSSVEALLQALDAGSELVIGSRFAGITSFRSTWLRRFGNRFLARLLSSLSHQRITDPTSGFRGFGPRAIRLFARTHPHDYPEPESVLIAARQGLTIAEVPVRMRPRLTGTSSLTAWKSAFYMAKVSFALLMERARPV
ncbi:glycosyltransferase family 2 protein [Pyxidicoccus fallax]|uniref:Glycosyltransferase family 2 protein n=1 Tax=Pyxidicoccus fallax TaxID=394095 RepID=A0A848LRK1_9BACT|nr:glycosyltransferase family 2 protein [Pyxidicoccus fallax]NMO20386.1 glycosyltransferase family 2 protein [Pyxidicoccus fallax]NPC81126.1 glycosyltransferase family 2 protein [Pyxidicoccus fallax]